MYLVISECDNQSKELSSRGSTNSANDDAVVDMLTFCISVHFSSMYINIFFILSIRNRNFESKYSISLVYIYKMEMNNPTVLSRNPLH